MKKPPKLDEKIRRKTGDLIDKKLLKPNKERKRKTDLQKLKNHQNLVRKTRKKTNYKYRDEEFISSESKV